MPRPLSSGKVLDAKAALDAVGVLGPEVQKAESITVYAVFGVGTTAGAVVVEAAHSPTFGGVWALLGTLAWSAANKASHLTVAGGHVAVRTRVSVAVLGGTVDTFAHVTG